MNEKIKMKIKHMMITILDKKHDEVPCNLMTFETNMSQSRNEFRNESIHKETDAITINTENVKQIQIEALDKNVINIFYREDE